MDVYLLLILFGLLSNVSCQISIKPAVSSKSGPCPEALRPRACTLSCPHGFAWGLGNSCVCICQIDPCLSKFCGFHEVCVATSGFARCISQSDLRKNEITMGECPKLVGGLCISKCKSDKGCPAQMKCCSNGCGSECVLPVNVVPILNSLPIQPIAVPKGQAIRNNQIGFYPERTPMIKSHKVDRIGHCPSRAALKERHCTVECNHDVDCQSEIQKCCDTGCGRVCVAPERATTCIHLLSAVERLPQKQLANGYLPICNPVDGAFTPVQCDLIDCWCVEVIDGKEMYGTRVPIDDRLNIVCESPPRKCFRNHCDAKKCLFGFRTDQQGCPLSNCECKNICDGVTCENKFDQCQSVEPDCAESPCSPVPRCLLNPCSNGLPMTLPNGVTALCTQSSQCGTDFWCHQIGYNGLGFCCPAPENAIRQGFCEARVPKHMTDCASECRSDSECLQASKCCFDGCGLKCMNVQFSPNPFQHKPASKTSSTIKTDPLRLNKEILSPLIAECPEIARNGGTQACNQECRADSDCKGLRRCCSSGCSRICIYPQKTTGCIHEAITHELYGLRKVPRCSAAGNYDEIQCDENRCYCVNPISGNEVPNTWVPLGNEPECAAIRGSSCPVLNCHLNCPFGWKLDSNGCPTCGCRNPCADVHCSQGQICIAADVICFSKSNCPAQARCVSNPCQGHPRTSSNGLVEQCLDTCPQGYWCNNVGYPTQGGVCCLENSSSRQQPINGVHPGTCPTIIISADLLSSSPVCKSRCFHDSECRNQGSKCCFDGCGTSCLQINHGSASFSPSIDSVNSVAPIKPAVTSSHKPGECMTVTSNPECHFEKDECVSDNDCDGLKKCCVDGCLKKCVYPYKTTTCLHLKAIFEKFNQKNTVKCTASGEFEDTQCDKKYCYCVDRLGRELVGTRVSNGLRPDCHARRLCDDPVCHNVMSCPHGFVKDSNGCNTCECETPCSKITCPDNQICLLTSVECKSDICPKMPKCSVNICPSGYPLFHESPKEPVMCRDHSQCRGSNTHCKMLMEREGYCCIGALPANHEGSCPNPASRVVSSPFDEEDCEVSCLQDADCEEKEKCCRLHGCSFQCVAVKASAAVASAQKPGEKIGECAVVDELGSKMCGDSDTDNCRDDDDCPSVQKCCFDGCAKTCQYGEIYTECLHLKASSDAFKSAKISGVFNPKCDAEGAFENVQRFRGLSWCVDPHGNEIPGTRTSRKNPDCLHPRSCPVMSCSGHCVWGPEMNDQGCPTCDCKNPCLNVQCPHNHVCRLVTVKCFQKRCAPVPRCILNVCPRGEPLERVDSNKLAECEDAEGSKCPQGWFCHKFGMGSAGYCCPGNVPSTQLNSDCPSVPILVTPRSHLSSKIECKLNHDCQINGPCCFNGAGTSCKNGVRRHSAEVESQSSTVEPVRAVTSILSNSEKIGVCPTNPIFNPGCRNECSRDSECPDFRKCCVYGCGRICQYPEVATACIHSLSSVNEELTKLLTLSKNFDDNISLKPPVQCTNDGLFRRIQCDSGIRQCWCVDLQSGIEIIGTRLTSLAGQEPNCLSPRICSTSCHDLKCEHGYKLDKNGCPVNGLCQCKDPCEELQCTKNTDICILKTVSCFNQPCPSIAVCKPNPCPSNAETLTDVNGRVISCSGDKDCGQGQCQSLMGESKLGVCCPNMEAAHHSSSSKSKLGSCPTVGLSGKSSADCMTECSGDSDCSGSFKCCSYGCNAICSAPVDATNCIHTQAAIEKLRTSSIQVGLFYPHCDSKTGMYTATQCDSVNCWCVDTVTGIEFYGTRMPGRKINACDTRHQCAIQCDEQISVCPFGLETNSQGCPRSSACQCRNPCDSVQCKSNEVCVLRPITECNDQTCLPVPTCEVNPCINNQKPAVEPRTHTQFTCLENRTQICPTGFYCSGYDSHKRGICCPGQEPILAQHSAVIMCPHGDAFSSSADGVPTECRVSKQDSCPNTHYCVSKPNHATGICCVTKRYVCNLDRDPGPCSADVPRFYYSAESQKCEPFMYGGCTGNLNNFGSESQCQKFCVGIGVDILGTSFNDAASSTTIDVYSMGFSLTGPLKRQRHSADINQQFLKYLTEHFDVDESEIRDLYIKDDNTVRFSIYSPHAKEKANNISNAVSNGELRFRYNGDNYRAQPQTWFLRQVDQEPTDSIFEGKYVYWVLLIACIIFAVIILFALCCGCAFLHKKKTKDTASSYRASPSPYGQISAYIPHGVSHSPARSSLSQHSAPVAGQRRGTRKQVLSTDDVNMMKMNAVGGGNLLMADDGQSIGAHTQGGRRPSRATLYY